jgi:inorganic pyrophosphatase
VRLSTAGARASDRVRSRSGLILMTKLNNLEPFDKDGHIRMVVETPRGSTVKLEYDTESARFAVSHGLALGVSYPFDWGFVPGTIAEDGDPIDALALHENTTYPGVILTCTAVGVVDLEQKSKKGRIANPRLILRPIWYERMDAVEDATKLPKKLREQLEQFFVSATFFTGKEPKIIGWRGPAAAKSLIRNAAKKA